MSEQHTGTVKWYNPEKAFGFIAVADGRDIFVHRSALGQQREWLIEGQEVRLTVQQGSKGPEASHVEVTRDVATSPRSAAYTQRQQTDPAGYRREYGSPGSSQAARPRREREPYRGVVPTDAVLAIVQRIDANGRFLFARVDEYGFDVYVHSSLFTQVGGSIREGDALYVTVQESERGLRAVTLRLP